MLGMSSAPREAAEGFSVRLDRENPYLRLQSVTIFVRDLEQSLEFYCRKLGFQLVFDARVQPGSRWVTVAPPDGAANLTLVAPEPDSEDYKLIGRPTHVTFVTRDCQVSRMEQVGSPFSIYAKVKAPHARGAGTHCEFRGFDDFRDRIGANLGRSVHAFQGSGRQFVFAGELR